MAIETKGKLEKLATEISDPMRRVAFLRKKIEAVRDGLIRTHTRAFPGGAKPNPASTGINRAIDDLRELMDLSDLADHLAKAALE